MPSMNWDGLRNGIIICAWVIGQNSLSVGIYFILMKKTDPAKEKQFFDKEEETIFNIITGKLRYPPEPFREEDLTPDIVIKLKVPNSAYIPRASYLSLSNFISSPQQRLERAYSKAEKVIASEMERNKENVDPLNLRMRLQLSLNTIDVSTKPCRLINEHEEEELLQLQCINSLNGMLDSFTLTYNTIIYTLQYVCGFRVKAFVLYDKEVTHRHVFLFLSLSTDNLLRVANKYRIKKEVEYTHFDFFLNDPTSNDDRPIKLNSKFISDKHNALQLKHISRFFNVKERAAKAEDIIEEIQLDDQGLDNFRSFNQELHILYEYLKYHQPIKLTSNEKMYLFQHNRRKLNPGVEKYYATMKKKKQFFQISKEILPKYGYKAWQEPVVFQQFTLPDKNSKGATFFNKLESILLYKPLVSAKDGRLSLFMNMQRTKLCYMVIKQHFKISYLALIGAEIMALDNDFEKFGGGDDDELRGGLDGECLVDKWPAYGLFADFKVIRSYMGERVAYEILYDTYLIGYMTSILVPYFILFMLEQVFGATVWTITSQVETLLYAVSYSVYMFYWQSTEDEFIKNYCDALESKMFLSKFRGPYVRNILSDEVNEFHQPQGMSAYLRNFLCLIIIVVLLVVLGAIFHGFRMMLVEIYDPLSDLQVADALSLPHLIAYALFFIVEEGFRLVVDKVIAFMVYLQNPPSDEDERKWEDALTFFYLLAIEMIPPFFLLILEPFQATSCYADSCQSQLTFYIYSRYVFILGVVVAKLIYVIIFKYFRKNFQKLLTKKKKEEFFYQDKLAALLWRAMDDSKKPQHKEDKMNVMTNLQNFAIYCTLLPISPIIMLFAIVIHYTSMRLSLINDERRPLNRSESIIRFSSQLKYIYYLGIFVNTWIDIYLLQLVELNIQVFIDTFNTTIDEEGIFMLKFIMVILYSLILIALGKISYLFAKGFSEDALNTRKDHKFNQYQTSRGGLKITIKQAKEMTPLKSVFRVFNPEQSNSDLLDKQFQGIQAMGTQDDQNAGSATSLQKM